MTGKPGGKRWGWPNAPCVSFALLVIVLVVAAYERTPKKRVARLPPVRSTRSFDKLVCKDSEAFIGSWELTIERNGHAILSTPSRTQTINLKDQIPQLEEVLRRNDAFELNGDIACDFIPFDSPILQLRLESGGHTSRVKLRWPWRGSEKTERLLAVYTFVRGLLDDKKLADKRPQIGEWLREQPGG